MAKLEAAFSIISSYSPPYSSKFSLYPQNLSSSTYRVSASTPISSVKSRLFPLCLVSINQTRKACFQLSSAVQEVQVVEEKTEVKEQEEEKTLQVNQRKKLFVLNLPWSLSVNEIKNLFGECGTVTDVEIIKHKDGKNRGFAFVTMANGEAAQAAVDMLDCREVSGRIIRVEYSRKFRKPRPSPPPSPTPVESCHKLYVSNLAWKVRSTGLKEFFAANFNPVSARVVFESPLGRSAGYGFVSFVTKEEAEAAISALDGKELLGRPIRLKFSVKNSSESDNEKKDESDNEKKDESGNEEKDESDNEKKDESDNEEKDESKNQEKVASLSQYEGEEKD